MFATLLDPAAFAAQREEQFALVASLGGPFFTHNVDDGAAARARGLQVALVVDAPDGVIDVRDLERILAFAPELCAVPLPDLRDVSVRARRIEQLAGSLSKLAGHHRLLLALETPLAALTPAEWSQLPIESLAIDPIGDPDAWRGAATLPGSCGLILGLIPPPGGNTPASTEVLLWGIRYAASLGARGGERVGIAGLPHRAGGVAPAIEVGDSAARVARLSDLLRLSSADTTTLREELDPRSFSPAAELLAARHKNEKV